MPHLQKPSLLEALSSRAGCSYLSDLRQKAFRQPLHAALEAISPHDFSLWEWNDAVEYLLHEPAAFATTAEARQFLLAHCIAEEPEAVSP